MWFFPQCSVESGGLLALLPDSVVCFATARYSQVQRFNLAPDASLVLVDWLTSGRIARGEVWNFEYFKSTNHVYIQEDTPLLLDSVYFHFTIQHLMCHSEVRVKVYFKI